MMQPEDLKAKLLVTRKEYIYLYDLDKESHDYLGAGAILCCDELLSFLQHTPHGDLNQFVRELILYGKLLFYKMKSNHDDEKDPYARGTKLIISQLAKRFYNGISCVIDYLNLLPMEEIVKVEAIAENIYFMGDMYRYEAKLESLPVYKEFQTIIAKHS